MIYFSWLDKYCNVDLNYCEFDRLGNTKIAARISRFCWLSQLTHVVPGHALVVTTWSGTNTCFGAEESGRVERENKGGRQYDGAIYGMTGRAKRWRFIIAVSEYLGNRHLHEIMTLSTFPCRRLVTRAKIGSKIQLHLISDYSCIDWAT